VWKKGSQLADPVFTKWKLLKNGHHGSIFCLALNDTIAVSGSFDHSVCVWDIENNFQLVAKLEGRHSDMGNWS
jgi:WD40 repeat protein